MREQRDIQLGPWRPDLGDLQHDGMAQAQNVYPVKGGYSLHPKADAVSTSVIDAIARGGYATKDNSGNANLFVGNASKLYRRTGATFSDVSKSGGYSSGDLWEFAQYDKTLIATNYDDIPQVFTVGASSAFADAAETSKIEAPQLNNVTGDHYLRSSGLTGASDGKQGTISVWVEINNTLPIFDIADDGASINGLRVSRSSPSGGLRVLGHDSSGTLVLSVASSTSYANGDLVHLLVSWDLASSTVHMYINNSDVKGTTSVTNTNIDYTKNQCAVGTSARNPGSAGTYKGVIGELWFNPSYIDLSDESNRRKFIREDGTPEDLGVDGSDPIGSAPLVYLTGAPDDFATNQGTGGDFTKSGSPDTYVLRAASAVAPSAKHVGVIGNFVFLGNTNDTANGAIPYRVQWSSIGDPSAFPTPGTNEAQETQADEEYLDPEYGPIMGISGGKKFGLVFQETAITRFEYIGGVAIFDVDTYETQRGLIAPRAFAKVGSKVYFLSQGGAYVTDGVNVEPIGDGVIDKTLIQDINRSNLSFMSTAVDYEKKLIYFAIPGSIGSDKVYLYHYLENRWSYCEWTDLIGDASAVVGCVVQGQTLDSDKEPRVWVLGGFEEENLLTYSEQFDNAAWNKVRASITANATTAPDGSVTADKLVENSDNNSHNASQTKALSANTTYMISVFAKAAERTQVAVQTANVGNWAASVIAVFDLSSGAVIGGSGTISSAGNGWYRCSITATFGASSAFGGINIFPASGGSHVYAGDGTSGVYIWGAQINEGTLRPYAGTEGTARDGSTVIHKLRQFTGDFAPFNLRTAIQEFPQLYYMDRAYVYGDSNTTFAPSADIGFKVYGSMTGSIGIAGGESGTHTATGFVNARMGTYDYRITARTAAFELSADSALTPTIQKVQKFKVSYSPAGDA